MGQLFFKKDMQTAVREGRKTTTLRRWRGARLRAGQNAYAPGVGWLRVESVEPVVDLALLGDADARADGFDTLAAMLETLAALYPDQASDGKGWFRIAFRVRALEPPRVRARPADEKPGLF